MDEMHAKQLNGSVLAYIGDGIYEVYIRRHVLEQGFTQVNRLHEASIKYVEASGQASVMKEWLKEDGLSAEEITFYKRGRNHRSNTRAKNASIADYRQATGFEALLGWLYLIGNHERMAELIHNAIQLIDQQENENESKER